MKQEPINYILRPATNDDLEFLFRLRLATMKPFFKDTHGWDDTEEREKVHSNLVHARIVRLAEEDIGVIKVVPKENELYLDQLQIRPAFQKTGIGARLLHDTIQYSEKLKIPITLFVITKSPAKCLYDPFGFILTEAYEHHCKMRREPDSEKE